MGDKVRRALAALGAAVFLAVLGVAGLQTPAQASLLSCYNNSICAFKIHPTPPLGSVIMPQRDSADADRNRCYPDPNGYSPTNVITNRSIFRWALFRTSNCTGSHISIAPMTEKVYGAYNGLPIGWNQIQSWYRTSSLS